MKNIKELLEKYDNGETSLEEEMQLQDFFQGEEVPDHLKSYQSEFSFYAQLDKVKAPISDEDLFARVDKEVEQLPDQTKVVKVDWFKSQSMGRVAAGLILIVVGYLAAQLLQRDSELDSMKEEMAQMKELMFEQLESSSASGRLQAVSNSMNMTSADEETVAALVETLNLDDNMHVRTKAVEALVYFGDDPMVNQALSDALSTEEEPAVQIAIINALVELKSDTAIETLEELTDDDDVLKDVRGEAQLGIFKLKEL